MSWKDTIEVRARQAGADWIVAHEKQLQAIIGQLQAATQIWKAGDASEQSGRAVKQFAVVKIGQTLITGRDAYSSDKKFGEWLKTLNLKSPFDDRRERSAAMRIAKLFSDEIRLVTEKTNDEDRRTSDEMSFVAEKLKLCPHTRPNDVWIWARKTGLIPRKPRNSEATTKARSSIRVAVENGQPVKRDKISQETGLSNGGVGRAHAMEQARLEGVVEGEAIALNEQGKLTKTQAKHIEALIKKHRRDLDAQFQAAVEAQVNKQVKERKASLEKAQEACAKQKNDAYKDQQYWKKLINGHKPPLSRTEYVDIQWVLRNEHATQDRRDRATIAFEAKELQLAGEKK